MVDHRVENFDPATFELFQTGTVVYRFEDAFVSGLGQVHDSQSHLISEGMAYHSNWEALSHRRHRGISPDHREASVLPLNAKLGSYNFHHWLIDVLPRVEAVENLDAGRLPLLLIPKVPASYIRATLPRLMKRYPGVAFKEVDAKEYTQARSVLLPHFIRPAYSAALSPEQLQFLRRLFAADQLHDPNVEVLYIARRDAAVRRLFNEDELIRRLEACAQVQVAHLSELGLSEQIRLVQQSRVVVGIHGAGLTHMVWGGPSTLVEILPFQVGDERQIAYATIAGLVGARYRAVIGSRQDLRQDFALGESQLSQVTAHVRSALEQG
jgi:capsular polysaccharide biosynthesis protein